jgi:hypothetical protein
MLSLRDSGSYKTLLQRVAQQLIDVRRFGYERLLEGPEEVEGACGGRPQHPSRGDRAPLRHLAGDRRALAEAAPGGGRCSLDALVEQEVLHLPHCAEERRALWRQLEENREATLLGEATLWSSTIARCGSGRIVGWGCGSTMSRAVRKLGWTYKQR